MRTRLSAVIVVAGLAGAAAALAPSAHAESSPSTYASRLVQDINAARAAHGLRALTVTSGTSTVASGWTSHLAAAQALSHNPDLASELESHGSPNWTTYGENVGEASASSADQLFTAYMNSPEHRANILGSAYRYVGVGVVFTGGTAWNTLDFVDQYGTTTTTTTTTTTKPRTVRHTTTTTTTAPRTAPKPAPRVVKAAPRKVVRHAVVRRPKPAPSVQAVTVPVAVPTPLALRPAAVVTSPVRVPSDTAHRIALLVALGTIAAAGVGFFRAVRAAAA